MSKDTGIVNIHGKQYQTVAYRVGKFREIHPEHSLITEVVSRDEDCVVMKAMIMDATGRVIATGHSEEYRKSSQINKTSALENAETSAIGRALAALGFGGTEFASADEVANAINQQKTITPTSGAWEAMDEETKAWMLAEAMEVAEMISSGDVEAACKHIDSLGMENEYKVAFWTRLDSKQRSALKKQWELMKAAA